MKSENQPLKDHRKTLSFTYEDLLRHSNIWPCAYGWWAWMNRQPWKPGVKDEVSR